jgi:NodT family efflux transporter outer membrane factor (OMF) lipoprotein
MAASVFCQAVRGEIGVAGCAGARVAIFGRAARRAMIDPFRAADCGNDCDTIAGQPESHRLARIFGRPLPAAPPGLTVLNVSPHCFSARSWSRPMVLSPAQCRAATLSRARTIAAVSVVALLAGCAVGPDFATPPAPETKDYEVGGTPQPTVENAADAQQRFSMGKKISGSWWQLFHSAQLDGVLQQAIAGNQTLVTAEATLAQAQQATAQARGVLWPQVDIGAGVQREQVSNGFLGAPGHTPAFNLFTIGPTVSYALDPFGGNRRRVEQQGAVADFQEYQLDAAYLTLTGGAASQAVQIASVRAQIQAVEAIIADDQRNLDLIGTQRRAGEATQLDVQLAESQLAADRTLLPPLRQQVSVARHALAILVGKAPGDWAPPDFDLAEFTLPQDLPVTLPSELVRQRPDILASEAQLHAASAAIGVATAQLYPNLTLSASFTQEALTTGTLFDPASSVWSVAAQLLAPVFHGGALRAQKQAAVDGFTGALATYKQTVLTSFGQVADTLQALAHDAELLEAQRRALESAETSLRLTRTTFRYGNVGILQVLDAQRQAEQARLGYVRAQAQRYFDSITLFTAMGGGWQDWHAQTAAVGTEAKPVADAR